MSEPSHPVLSHVRLILFEADDASCVKICNPFVNFG
jgi:hypothetical protein